MQLFVLVKVQTTHKSRFNTRVYDKKHSCFYCNKMYSKIGRHLENVHGSEAEVAQATSFPKNSKKRRHALDDLRRKGDFHHNAKVLSSGQGDLIVCKRPTQGEEVSSNSFLPCSGCQGFYRREELWRHAKLCTEKQSEVNKDSVQNNRRYVLDGKMMLIPFTCPKSSPMLNERVLKRMKNDNIAFRAQRDDLILMFGTSLIEKGGVVQPEDVSQRMRQLARLLIQLNKTQEGSLESFLKPENFDLVIMAVKSLCEFEPQKPDEVKTPSLALKIGHALTRCLKILKGKALREKDDELLKDCANFLALVESEWGDKISSFSLATLSKRKRNNVELLPLASDLQKIKSYMEDSMKVLSETLQDAPTPDAWGELCQVTASRLIIFNKRRSGEASRLLLEDYENRPNWGDARCQEIYQSLHPLESQLCKR